MITMIIRSTITLIYRFRRIDEVCNACHKLIKKYTLIRAVNVIRTNLSGTLTEVDRLLRIPEAVSETTVDHSLFILD
jgi:hypothetical protein